MESGGCFPCDWLKRGWDTLEDSSCLSSAEGNDRTHNMSEVSLTPNDLKLIREHWPKLIRSYPELIKDSWLKTIQRSELIARTFNIVPGDDIEQNRPFQKLILAVEAFFHRIIVIQDLDVNSCEKACVQLGFSHYKYCVKGFEPLFWDIFKVCLLDSLRQCIKRDDDAQCALVKSNKQQCLLLCSWHKLVHLIVEQMRFGYYKAQNEALGLFGLDKEPQRKSELYSVL